MNELNQHKKSDSIKWIITFVMLILLAVSVVALGAKEFGEGADIGITTDDDANKTNPDVENNKTETGEELNTLQVVNSDLMMLSVVPYAAEPASDAIAAYSNNYVEVTATVLPAGCDQRLEWTVEFVNPTATWANGKSASNYVAVNALNDDATKVEVSAIAAFASQIKITATSVTNPAATAYITVDYSQKLLADALLGIDSNDFFASSPVTGEMNYVKGIPYLTASQLASRYDMAIELEYFLSLCTIETETCTTDFMVKCSEKFLAALNAKGIAAKNTDYTYLGDANTGITAALLINTLTGYNIIPEADGTANTDMLYKFNQAALSIGDAMAFEIMVQVTTDNEQNAYTFQFVFDDTTIPAAANSIQFNVSNIVL